MESEKLKLPRMGFGTWQLSKADCKAAVLKAIDTGYTFIDTAQMYFNEAQVGEAIAACGKSRDDLIIATKVTPLKLSYNNVLKSTEVSLKKLGLKTIDLLYVHWPTPLFYKPKQTLKAFSELVDAGKVRFIGISNFNPEQVDKAIEVLKALDKPVIANQILHHPLKPQLKLREHLQEKGIYLVAYSPLARGKVFKVPVLQEIAKKHGTSAGQVSLAWIMAHSAIPIPKATGEAHIKDNFDSQDLVLDAEDIAAIDGLKK
ncbi:MAG TPA: aldo/keto reductase [Candidatus Lokiarchaeia archaeon]|nr:aldo/keto reductase [Candidatus Lokiarchaeia archaeon]